MTRRAVLVAAASWMLAAVAATAQETGRKRRIGILSPRPKPTNWNEEPYSEFLKALRELGYVEARNLELEWRFAENAKSMPRVGTIVATSAFTTSHAH